MGTHRDGSRMSETHPLASALNTQAEAVMGDRMTSTLALTTDRAEHRLVPFQQQVSSNHLPPSTEA
jgi:hypothetical protein